MNRATFQTLAIKGAFAGVLINQVEAVKQRAAVNQIDSVFGFQVEREQIVTHQMDVEFVLIDDQRPNDNEFSKEIGHEEHWMVLRRWIRAGLLVEVEQTDSAILPLDPSESVGEVGR